MYRPPADMPQFRPVPAVPPFPGASSGGPFMLPVTPTPQFSVTRPHQYTYSLPCAQPPQTALPLPAPAGRVFVSALSQMPPSQSSPSVRPTVASAPTTPVQPPVTARPSSASTAAVLPVPPVPRPLQLQSSFSQVSVTPRWPSLPQFQPFPARTLSYAALIPPPLSSIRPAGFHPPRLAWPVLEKPSPPPPPPAPQTMSMEKSLPTATTYAPEPPKPSDFEMLKNIDVLAAFVVKNGPPFESMARARQEGDPKFAFLFENNQTPEASIGHTYYKWKKQVLTLETKKESSKMVEPQKTGSVPDSEVMIDQSDRHADSPVVSDMDVGDDFVPSLPVKREHWQNVRLDGGGTNVVSISSGVSKLLDNDSSSDADSERHTQIEGNNEKSESHISNNCLESHSEIRVGDTVNVKAKMLKCCDNNDRETPDNVINKAIEHHHNPEVFNEPSSVLLMTGTHNQSMVTSQQNFEHGRFSISSDNIEIRRMDIKEETEVLYDHHQLNGASELPSIPVKQPLGWKESECSNNVLENGNINHVLKWKGSLDAGTADAAHLRTREDAVDAFGRLVRKEEFGRDPEGRQRCRKRDRSFSRSSSGSRSSSRSISRSPSPQSRRNVCHSPSPEQLRRSTRCSPSPARRRRWRRNRSWSSSRSPQLQDKYSRSPSKDTKWGTEPDKRNDDNFHALDSMREKGNGSDLCFHYARGRCFRGDACRFLHPDKETVEERGTALLKNRDAQLDVAISENRFPGCESYIFNSKILPDDSFNCKPEVYEAWSAHRKERNSHSEMLNNELLSHPTSETSKGFKFLNAASVSLNEYDGIVNVDKGPVTTDHENVKTIGKSKHQSETKEEAIIMEQNLDVDVTDNHDLRRQVNSHDMSRTVSVVGVQECSSGDRNIQNQQSSTPACSPQRPTMMHYPHAGNMRFNLGSPCTPTKIVSNPVGISSSLPLLMRQEPGTMDVPSISSQSCLEHHAGSYQYGHQYGPHVSYQKNTYVVSQNSVTGAHQQSVLPDATSQHFALKDVLPYPGKHLDSRQCGFSGNAFLQNGDIIHHDSIRSDISKKLITLNTRNSSQHEFLGTTQEKQLLSYSYSLTTIPPLNLPDGLKIQTFHNEYGSSFDGIDLGASCKKGSVIESLENVSPVLESEKTNKFTDESEADNAQIDVGIVENVSPAGICSVAQSECGTENGNDQANSQSKKNIRGLKLLQTAVADQVKLLLKPFWREGRMSKEAYKTIVKKAVEKVTGSLASHHIPKSQEKVEHFIAVSKPKISKLVKGYVDKYHKK